MLLARRTMDRLLARLERTVGRYAIPNLILYIVGGMAVVWCLQQFGHVDVVSRITLDLGAVLHGQVWRLVTFLFIPLDSSPWWVLLNLYFAWWVGTSLEQHWGAFKFNAFYFMGVVGTVIAAFLTGPQTNFWLDASLFLAFATTFPDIQVLLLFILPIRVKWLGIVAALGIGAALLLGDWTTRAAIGAATGNYLLFFGGHWMQVWRSRKSPGAAEGAPRATPERRSSRLRAARLRDVRRARGRWRRHPRLLLRNVAARRERFAWSMRAITSW